MIKLEFSPKFKKTYGKTKDNILKQKIKKQKKDIRKSKSWKTNEKHKKRHKRTLH